MQRLEIPEYLKHVEKRFNEEYNRLLHYLHSSTKYALLVVSQFFFKHLFLLLFNRVPLISCLEKQLIAEHIPTMLNKGLDSMLDEHRIDDLKLLYQLVSRIKNGVDQLKLAYSQYIKVISRYARFNFKS